MVYIFFSAFNEVCSLEHLIPKINNCITKGLEFEAIMKAPRISASKRMG